MQRFRRGLIEFFVNRKEQWDRVRIRTVRLMRGFERSVTFLLLYKQAAELERMKREIKWRERIHEQRNKHFSPDERKDVAQFYLLIDEFCALIPRFKEPASTEPFSFTDEAKAKLLAKDIELARIKEENILEETEEDSGLW